MAKDLSTFDIAEMLGVDPGSVANWVDRGLLKAHRTPGGHRRIDPNDLRDFLRKQKMPVPSELGPTQVRVLIVDDEPAITQMISRAINDAHPDYDIIEAHDGFRAGTIMTTLRPEVVVLDIRMAGMDGYDVCRMIKSHEQTKSTEVIAITAYPSDESEQRILGCGAKACLPKPLDLDVLLAEIEAAI